MSNIVGEGFPDEILKQIEIRQQKKGTQNRNPGGDPSLLVWQNSNTGWVRLTSSVNVNPERYTLLHNQYLQGKDALVDNHLAKQYVLFGGTYDQTLVLHAAGISRDSSVFNNNAYGLGGLELGLRPMPGITSFSIRTETRGSLKTATIGIKAYNRTQFDIINMLYLSLGYSVLIEWGNAMYYDNDGNFIKDNSYNLSNDFLEGTYKWDTILPKIQKNRLASKGNYDAALGKIVNFSWTIDKDLSYNITLTVRTIGDVIESLKTNILSGNIPLSFGTPLVYNINQTPPPSSALNTSFLLSSNGSLPNTSIIPDFANSSDIGRLLYNIQLQFTNKNTVSNPTNPNDIVAIKQTYNSGGSNGRDEYYISLGYFLTLFQQYIVPNVDYDSTLKMIKFDTDPENTIISLYGRQVSANPGVCIFKRTFDKETIQICPQGNNFQFSINNSTFLYGKFMNVYFNMTYIINKLTELKDSEGNVSLINFLRIFSQGFNISTGNYNKLDVTVDEDNYVRFIDQVPLADKKYFLKKGGKPTEPAFFSLYGYYPVPNTTGSLAGFIRDVNFQTTISPDLATIITIGAQANGYVTGQDSTALSSLNRGLVDRVKNEFTTPNTTKPQPVQNGVPLVYNTTQINANTFTPGTSNFLQTGAPQQTNTPPPPPTLEEKYKTEIAAFVKFIKTLGSVNGSTPSWDQKAIDNFSNLNAQFVEYDQYYATANARLTNPDASSPTIGFIPFSLSLTMDGLSGMKVYQSYTLDTSFLPSNYPTSLEFLIKGITHEIKDNQWITTIESFAIPKNPYSSTSSDYGITSFGRSTGVSSNVKGTNYNNVNADKIYKFFISKGFTPFQAAGFVGNFNQESRLDPTTTNSIGAIGLAQWLGARKTNLLQQPNPYSLDTQLNFVWTELTTTEKSAYNKIKATTNITDATIAIRQYYERPNPSEANDGARIKYALNVLNQENNNIA